MANVTSPPDSTTTFERLPTEPMKAWQAFVAYRNMGYDRTMDAVRIALARPSGYLRQLQDWSGRYEWVRRARLFDDHIERSARREAQRSIPLWEKLRQDALRANIELTAKLRERIESMLMHPLLKERVEVGANGRSTVYLIPAGWNWSSIATMVKCLSELEAATIAEGLLDEEAEAFDPATATLQECRDFIEKKIVRTKGRPSSD
jgi:hypothetical protein